ncbi:hypothetical protein ACFQX8_27080 [Klenkia terrae]|uniref:hypothetical protein n=1 Tax=Klenkia terrae TaxID=1052259 RepID=UPI00360BD972
MPRWRVGRRDGRAGGPGGLGLVVVLVVPGGDGTAPATGGGGDDLVLVLDRLLGDLVLGGLELGGVVDPGGLGVDLLVGELAVGGLGDTVGGLGAGTTGRAPVLGARLLVAHCASPRRRCSSGG